MSDPQAQIRLESTIALCHEKQGSEQATFLLCSGCQSIVGVCYIDEGVLVGSMNATLLEQYEMLKGSLVISPKQLTQTEKVMRWRDIYPCYLKMTDSAGV